jgi:hypothetical protein
MTHIVLQLTGNSGMQPNLRVCAVQCKVRNTVRDGSAGHSTSKLRVVPTWERW